MPEGREPWIPWIQARLSLSAHCLTSVNLANVAQTMTLRTGRPACVQLCTMGTSHSAGSLEEFRPLICSSFLGLEARTRELMHGSLPGVTPKGGDT